MKLCSQDASATHFCSARTMIFSRHPFASLVADFAVFFAMPVHSSAAKFNCASTVHWSFPSSFFLSLGAKLMFLPLKSWTLHCKGCLKGAYWPKSPLEMRWTITTKESVDGQEITQGTSSWSPLHTIPHWVAYARKGPQQWSFTASTASTAYDSCNNNAFIKRL